MKFTRLAIAPAIAALIAGLAVAPTYAAGNSKNQPNENAIGFWTAERLANAIPRDFEFEPGAKSGKLIETGKPSKGSGGTTTTSVSGANWNNGGLPLSATGKVFFKEGTLTYVCSGSIVNESNSSNLIVLTAGHCAYDNTTKSFVTNFVFIPAYDTSKSTNCFIPYCLPAKALVAHKGFTSETSFTTIATQYDWAFAVIDQSYKDIAGFNFNVSGFSAVGNVANSFGYPQESPYNGQELVYCVGNITEDSLVGNKTWGLGCNMTGGASGGPWISSFSTSPVASSVNSYKYTNNKNTMYGPKFNTSTTTTFNTAVNYSGSGNLIVT